MLKLHPGRLLAVARKEALQLRRDPRSLAMGFIVPAAMVLFFGYIISFDVKDIKIGVEDRDGTPRSREFVQAFVGSGWFRVTERVERASDAVALLDRAKVRLVLTIPNGFQSDLAAGRRVAVQAIVDGADANTASIALNYANAIVNSYTASVVFGSSVRNVPITSPESLRS